MLVRIEFYETWDDYYHKKNKKSKYFTVTAFKHNRDTLKLYYYDTCMLNTAKQRWYIDQITFDSSHRRHG